MSGWEPERSAESWSDTESWRGEIHLDSDETWRGETLAVWEEEDSSGDGEDEDEDDEPEILDEADWPENLAGPEYWLFKRDGL